MNFETEAVVAKEARAAHDAWLEKVVNDILSTGVTRDEIAVHFRSGLRTVVTVRGEDKYEYSPPGLERGAD